MNVKAILLDNGCRWRIGEKGVVIDNDGRIHGVIECVMQNYISVIANAKSDIGGTYEDVCDKCSFYQARGDKP